MATSNLAIVVSAQDNASKVLGGVGNSVKSLSQSLQSFGMNATKNLTIPIVAATYAIGKLVEEAGRFQSITDAYRTMSASFGIEGKQLITSVKSAVSGTVDSLQIMSNFMKASTLIGEEALGESGENFVRFATIAKKSARATGKDVDFMFESIINGIGRASVRWLDNTGVVVKAVDAYKAFGETIGKTGGELTATEQKIALTNAFLERAEKQYANVAVTAGGYSSSLQRMNVALREAALAMGMALMPAVQKLVEAITPLITTFGPVLIAVFGQISTAIGNLPEPVLLAAAGFIAFLAVLGPVALALSILGPALAIAAEFGIIFAKVAVVVGLLAAVFKKFGPTAVDFKEGLITIKGFLQPFVDKFQFAFERIKQILAEKGISGEFGRLKSWFSDLVEKVEFYSERLAQIVGEAWQKLKNFLAFGGTEGDATIIQALEGIWNRLKILKENMQPFFDMLAEKFALVGQIINTQLKPAFDALVEVLKPFWEALKPELMEFVKGLFIAIAGALGLLITTIVGIFAGLVGGLANALPYIMQAVEGLIQFFRGFIQILTGLLNGDWRMILEGFMQMIKGAADFVINAFDALLMFISGFIKSVVMFFQGLYQTLVGGSIIPDIVNGIISWFTDLKDRALSIVSNIVSGISEKFKSLISSAFGWGKDLISGFVDGIKNAVSNLGGAIKGFMADKLGLNFHTGGVVPGPIGADVPIMAQAGETILPAGVGASSGGNSGGINFNVTIGMYAGTDTEKRTIAKDLYGALLQLANSQGKSVNEYMGG